MFGFPLMSLFPTPSRAPWALSRLFSITLAPMIFRFLLPIRSVKW